ncbi:MAG TPA: RIP metalloprotease RseP [Acetobacteraceae bacterium]
MLHALPDVIRSGVAFAIVLGVLVFVHEFGHYLAARLCGVHVEVFSIGFGRAITSWVDRQGTRWKIAWLPLGGYVKMHGQERPEDVSPQVRAAWIPGRTFHEKTVLQRAIVVSAGPVANFLLAMVLFGALFASMGKPVTMPVVGDVLAGSAADHAGLKANDRIDSIAGQPIRTFEDIQRIITAHPDDTLSLTITRDGVTSTVQAHTEAQVSDGQRIGMLGIRGGTIEYYHIGLGLALWGGVTQTWDVTSETVAGIGQMIAGTRGTEDLGGPLRIAQLSGQVAELGFASLVTFIAVLSVNLGLINLFPIPVLDGGHLLFYLAEAIRGRPLPARAQEYGFRAGLAVLASLFIFATWNDLSNIGLFHWVAHLIG